MTRLLDDIVRSLVYISMDDKANNIAALEVSENIMYRIRNACNSVLLFWK